MRNRVEKCHTRKICRPFQKLTFADYDLRRDCGKRNRRTSVAKSKSLARPLVKLVENSLLENISICKDSFAFFRLISQEN